MRALVYVVLLAVAALAACDPDARTPKSELPDSLLVRALAEVHIASARALHAGEPADSLRAVAFEQLGVDSVQVSRALDAYAERPAALADLYARVTDRLRESSEDLDEARRALHPEEAPFDTLEQERHRLTIEDLHLLDPVRP